MARLLLCFLLVFCLACEGDSSSTTSQESPGESLLEEGIEEETGQETVGECVPTHEDPATWYRDIEQIFYENCQVCHAEQPLYGAPMPLASFADVTGPGWLPSDTSMVAAIIRSIEDGSMPPAGQIQLTPTEEEKVRDWAANCAPEGDIEDAVTLQSNVEPQVPPPPTDAEVIRIDANEHDVLPGQDQYMCFPMVLNFEGDKDIVRIDFDLDEAGVIHHMVLYADFDKAAEDGKPFECLQIAVEHSAFLFEWGPGGMPMHLPEGAGIEMNSGDQVILQVHYSNLQALEGLKDSSGLNLYLGEENPNKVAMFASGPLGYTIPPFSEKSVENTCVFDTPVTLLSSTPHMHLAGRNFLTEVIRADGTVETLVKLDAWDFFHQSMYDTPVEIQPGDALRTVCTLENTSAQSLYAGDTTEAEMCFNFMYHTPPLGKLFCDVPAIPDFPEFDLENLPCSEGTGLVKGDTLVAPNAKVYGEVAPMVIGDEVLPDGSWVATEMDLYLYHFAGRLFELIDFDVTKLKVNFAMFVEGGDTVTMDVLYAVVMVPVSGGIVEMSGEAGRTSRLEYDAELSGLVPVEELCEAETEEMKILYVRLKSVEERLEGIIGLERKADGEQFAFDLVLERPSL